MNSNENKMSCGELILETLDSFGVGRIFSSPGSEWPPVWEALAKRTAIGKKKPEYVNCRHEMLAVAAAMASSDIEGNLTALLLHTSAGTLNASMGLRTARYEQIPLVVLAGESQSFGEGPMDVGSHWLRSLSDVGGPARIADRFVKWSESVANPETLVSKLQHACRIALAPPQGPTFLSIPLEVMLQEASPSSLLNRSNATIITQPDNKVINVISDLLLKSSSPVIVTEYAGRRPETVNALVSLAESASIPVIEAQNPCYMNFPRNHKLHFGYEGKHFLEKSDLVILVAVRGPWNAASWRPETRTKIVLIDDDPVKSTMPIWPFSVDVCAAGSITSTLNGITAKIKENLNQDASSREKVKERDRRHSVIHDENALKLDQAAKSSSNKKPLSSHWAGHVINKVIPKDAIVVVEITSQRPFILRHLERSEPGTYFTHPGGLGTGLGFAVGAKLIQQDKLVVALLGDGTMNYNPLLPCLGFIQEYRTPILMILFNNYGYASMKAGIIRFYPEGWAVKSGVFYGSNIAPSPNYTGVIEAMGGYSETVDEPSKFELALARGVDRVSSGQMALIEVLMNREDERKTDHSRATESD